jgi:thioredoxin-related protein
MEKRENDEIVWKLVSIENDIARLAVILDKEPLEKRALIEDLLHDIETMAINCRKRLMMLEFKNYTPANKIKKSIVTQKEIRELLEAFA